MDKSLVAITRCGSYSKAEVGSAVDRLIDGIGGLEKSLRPGMKVLVKPNLLLASAPEKAITTHPAVMTAIIKRLMDFGCHVSFGDLPGGFHVASTKKVHKICGMEDVAKETGAELVTLEKYGFVEREIIDGVTLKLVHVSKFLEEVDAIVNVCKVKTHMQSKFTGAVKNMFGMVTTQDRLVAHRHAGVEEFSNALLDIFSVTTPVLNFADGIVGMEGTGPSQGSPVELGFLGASTDAVALDTVLVTLMGMSPREIGTIEAARARKMGATRMREIALAGDSLEPLVKKVKRPSGAVAAMIPFMSSIMTEMFAVKPEINKKACKKCRTCVEVCPNNAVSFSGKHFEIHESRCLKCFCCHEMCPHDAVDVKKPLVVKIVEKLTN